MGMGMPLMMGGGAGLLGGMLLADSLDGGGYLKFCITPLLVVDNRWSEQGTVVDTVAETWVEETWVEATWAAVVVSKTMESRNQLYLPDDGSRSSICQAVWTSQQSRDYAAVLVECKKGCKMKDMTEMSWYCFLISTRLHAPISLSPLFTPSTLPFSPSSSLSPHHVTSQYISKAIRPLHTASISTPPTSLPVCNNSHIPFTVAVQPLLTKT